MLQFLFLLLFASNGLAISISQDVIASEQSYIVELYSSFNKVESESEDSDSIASNQPSFDRTSYQQHLNQNSPSVHDQRPYSLYSTRAPPVFRI